MPRIGASDPIRIIFPISDEGEVIIADRRQAIIHPGLEWVSSYKNPDATEIVDNANFDLLFVTVNSKARFNYRVNASQVYELSFYENPTVTNNGVALFRRNYNRLLVQNRPTARVYRTPIIGAVGDLLINEIAIGPSGGPGDGFADWILSDNSTYLIRLTNRSGQALASMSIVVTWDEL